MYSNNPGIYKGNKLKIIIFLIHLSYILISKVGIPLIKWKFDGELHRNILTEQLSWHLHKNLQLYNIPMEISRLNKLLYFQKPIF